MAKMLFERGDICATQDGIENLILKAEDGMYEVMHLCDGNIPLISFKENDKLEWKKGDTFTQPAEVFEKFNYLYRLKDGKE